MGSAVACGSDELLRVTSSAGHRPHHMAGLNRAPHVSPGSYTGGQGFPILFQQDPENRPSRLLLYKSPPQEVRAFAPAHERQK